MSSGWFIVINSFFMVASLWVAFAKANRPITWTAFYLNLVAAGINLISILVNFWRLVST